MEIIYFQNAKITKKESNMFTIDRSAMFLNYYIKENTCDNDNKDEYLERNYCSLPLYKATPANGHLRFLMQRLPPLV